MPLNKSVQKVRIGDVLKERGYIDNDQLNSALVYQHGHRGIRLGEALIALGYITEDQLLEALSSRLNIPVKDVGNVSVDINAVSLVPEEIARSAHALAYAVKGNTLRVLTSDPADYFGQEEIRQHTGLDLEVAGCKSAPIERAIDYYYSEVSMYRQAEDASNDFRSIEELSNLDIDNVRDTDAPIVNLLNSLIYHAISVGASDVHMEPFQDFVNVRLRIDGVLNNYLTLKRSVHSPLIARLKIVSNLDIAERHLPQDGHFRTRINGEYVNVRVSIVPTVYGEKAVLRLLSNRTHIDNSGTFGMSREDYEHFCHILDTPNGVIYITGPTGCGKTTTLYMVLMALADEKLNIVTIEDPVERNLPHINQVQVNEQAGLTFEEGLRAFMRQDPDIIMVGETRDSETASISVRSAITGHLVLSTLHTNDAVSTIDRLIDMGVAPYMVASSLAGIVAQRLMRKVCPYCSISRPATETELKILGYAPETQLVLREGKGCQKCNQSGYKDRIAIHEIMAIDTTIKRMIANGAQSSDIQKLAIDQQHMRTLAQSAARMTASGQTTMEEYLKIVYQV